MVLEFKMKLIFALLLTIGACASNVIDVHLVHLTGKELVFDYETLVEVGTREPDIYTSMYKIHAKLHVQGTKDGLLTVQLTNIVFHLDNGLEKIHKKEEFLPIPDESNLLTLPFQVHLDKTGKFSGIVVDKTDKEYSINIKKSIASLFQIDRTQFTNWNKQTGHFGVTTEETVYGKCEVQYDIVEDVDNMVKLIKTQDPKTCQHHFREMKRDDVVSTESGRKYLFVNKDGHLHLKKIIAHGNSIVTLFGQFSGVNVIHVVQHLELKNEVDLTKPIEMKDGVTFEHLKVVEPLVKCRENALSSVYDITGGRRNIPYDLAIKQVHSLLDKLADFLATKHITFTKLDIHNIDTVAMILNILETFDLQHLEQCYVLLEEKKGEEHKLNLLTQLLPNIGTRASIVFIRNLIRKHKISEPLAMKVLVTLVDAVRCPSEKLLTEIEDMMTLGGDDVNNKLNRVGILTFASLVRQTFFHVDEKSPVLEKYINMFWEKFKSTDNYKMKLIYLQALSNIGIGSVLKHLDPIITGEEVVDHQLRIYALIAVAPRLARDPMLMLKYIMPILTNKLLDTETRLIAYCVFIKTVKPTLPRFMKLFYIMKYEKDEKMYNFHYNTMLSYSKMQCQTVDQCHLVDICRTIVRLSRHPFITNRLDGYHKREFVHYDRQFNIDLEYFMMRTDFTKAFKFQFSLQMAQNNYDITTVYVRLISKTNKVQTDSKDLYKDLLTKEKYTIEMSLRRKGRIILVDVMEDANLIDFVKQLTMMDIFNKDKKTYELLDVPNNFKNIMPSDLGVPIVLFMQMPVIEQIKLDFHFEDPILFSFDMTYLGATCIGMKIYNPVTDLYHGIHNVNTVTMNVPLRLEVSKKPDQPVLNFIHKVEKDDVFGLERYISSAVFIEGFENKHWLEKFDTNEHVHAMVTRGKQYEKDIVIFDQKLDNIGHHLFVKIFNCDRDVSRESILYQLHELFHKFWHQTENYSMILFDLLRLRETLFLQSEIGQCGVTFQLKPFENIDRIETDVKLKIDSENQDHLLRSLNFNALSTITFKTADNTDLLCYDLKYTFKVEELHRVFNMKLLILQKLLGVEKWKFDLDLTTELAKTDMGTKIKIHTGPVDKLWNLDIVAKGLFSDQQLTIFNDKKTVCKECHRELLNHKYYAPFSLDCARCMSTLRRYQIDVKFSDITNGMFIKFFDYLHFLELKKVTFIDKTETDNKVMTENVVKDMNHVHFDVFFPLLRDHEFEVKMETKDFVERFIGPRTKVELFEMFMSPINLFYGRMDLRRFIELGRFETCSVSKYGYVNDHDEKILTHDMSTDYTVYYRGVTKTGQYVVEVKKLDTGVDKNLALRVTVDKEVLEVIPVDDQHCDLIINGKKVTSKYGEYTIEGVFQYFIIPHPKILMLQSSLYGLEILFDGRVVRIMSSLHLVEKLDGTCIATHRATP